MRGNWPSHNEASGLAQVHERVERLTMNELSVSIVIPTYLREKPLRETLNGILAQHHPSLREVIVVDQSPSHEPETEAFLSAIMDRIRYLRLERPHVTAARNAGVRAAGGDIVLFFDDDIYPGPDLCQWHLQAYADPSVGGVAGRVHISPFPDLQDYPWPDGPDIFDRNEPGERPFVRGCHMSFRRALILQAGLFDERYVDNAAGEEEDLAFAIRRLGYRIVYEPRAWVIHLMAPTGGCRAKTGNRRDTPAFYRNKVYFALKNVSGLDFWRILWDTYYSGTWRGPHRLRRHIAFVKGLWQGWRTYHQAGWRLSRLPYRWREPKRSSP